jgi:hypothetical protein
MVNLARLAHTPYFAVAQTMCIALPYVDRPTNQGRVSLTTSDARLTDPAFAGSVSLYRQTPLIGLLLCLNWYPLWLIGKKSTRRLRRHSR